MARQFAAGRTMWNLGVPVQNPSSGPVFRPAVQAVRARLPQAPIGAGAFRGRVYSNAGTSVQKPALGPVFSQATSPARAASRSFSRARAGFPPTPAARPEPVTGSGFRHCRSRPARRPRCSAWGVPGRALAHRPGIRVRVRSPTPCRILSGRSCPSSRSCAAGSTPIPAPLPAARSRDPTVFRLPAGPATAAVRVLPPRGRVSSIYEALHQARRPTLRKVPSAPASRSFSRARAGFPPTPAARPGTLSRVRRSAGPRSLYRPGRPCRHGGATPATRGHRRWPRLLPGRSSTRKARSAHTCRYPHGAPAAPSGSIRYRQIPSRARCSCRRSGQLRPGSRSPQGAGLPRTRAARSATPPRLPPGRPSASQASQRGSARPSRRGEGRPGTPAARSATRYPAPPARSSTRVTPQPPASPCHAVAPAVRSGSIQYRSATRPQVRRSSSPRRRCGPGSRSRRPRAGPAPARPPLPSRPRTSWPSPGRCPGQCTRRSRLCCADGSRRTPAAPSRTGPRAGPAPSSGRATPPRPSSPFPAVAPAVRSGSARCPSIRHRDPRFTRCTDLSGWLAGHPARSARDQRKAARVAASPTRACPCGSGTAPPTSSGRQKTRTSRGRQAPGVPMGDRRPLPRLGLTGGECGVLDHRHVPSVPPVLLRAGQRHETGGRIQPDRRHRAVRVRRNPDIRPAERGLGYRVLGHEHSSVFYPYSAKCLVGPRGQ